MSFTAGDMINRALRLLGVLAEGETPSSDTSADALVALNQMIDSWNTERLAVFSTQDQTFTWPSGQQSRTLGPSGNFVGTRPILLDDSTYYVYNSVSYPIAFINQEQYDAIALKTVTSTVPQLMFVNTGYPDITMYLYPVPTADLTFHFISVEELDQPATTSTNMTFPPGYLRAFVYNLACELAPEFGIEPSKQVQRVAMTSKRNLKRINNPDDVMIFPASVLSGYPAFNIYTGLP